MRRFNPRRIIITVHRPTMLLILDGWGWREDAEDNAVRQARTPNFDRLWSSYPHAFLRTSGLDVGLPEGQMGNSEVGHLNLGAGRVVMQDLPRINQAIADGSISQAPALTDLIARLRETGGTCHLFGLISPGGVHSHQDHAVALESFLTQTTFPLPSMCSRMGATLHPIPQPRTSAPSKRLCRQQRRSRRSAAGTSRWIATIVGIACHKHSQPWSEGRASGSIPHKPQLRVAMRRGQPTSSCHRP